MFSTELKLFCEIDPCTLFITFPSFIFHQIWKKIMEIVTQVKFKNKGMNNLTLFSCLVVRSNKVRIWITAILLTKPFEYLISKCPYCQMVVLSRDCSMTRVTYFMTAIQITIPNGPFGCQTIVHNLNTGVVRNSDPPDFADFLWKWVSSTLVVSKIIRKNYFRQLPYFVVTCWK